MVDVKFHWFFATFSKKKDTNTTEFNADTSGVFYKLITTLQYLKIVLYTSKYLIFVLVKTDFCNLHIQNSASAHKIAVLNVQVFIRRILFDHATI